MKIKKPKLYKCLEKAKGCLAEGYPWTSNFAFSGNKYCCQNPNCVLRRTVKIREREETKKRSVSAREKKETRERLKTRSQWIKEVQIEFNAFIRLRDHDDPCISSGKLDCEITDRYRGGKWDAGHFLTRGGFPELRFDEDNCHKQSKSDNNPGPNKAVKVQKQYRVNLIKKIGLKRVESLEGPHDMPKWTIDELKKLKAKYKAKVKELKKERGE